MASRFYIIQSRGTRRDDGPDIWDSAATMAEARRELDLMRRCYPAFRFTIATAAAVDAAARRADIAFARRQGRH